jgi:hypothetical protein
MESKKDNPSLPLSDINIEDVLTNLPLPLSVVIEPTRRNKNPFVKSIV